MQIHNELGAMNRYAAITMKGQHCGMMGDTLSCVQARTLSQAKTRPKSHASIIIDHTRQIRIGAPSKTGRTLGSTTFMSGSMSESCDVS
mmetsp:Transcript_48031/g.125680  ORF Transcript_48031/g.125680 Transcript_48031/m.125680 type:complete len:89 (+) Transcript_48031:415-681(+)